MAAPRKKAEAAPAAKPAGGEGGELYLALLEATKKSKVGGELVPHAHGLYTRLRVDGRTAAYIVRGKTVATVYPNALASDVPDGLTFRTVELGSHHYGRGEIVVPVASPDDFPNAIGMLKASLKMPAVPKNAAPVAVEA